MPDDKTKPSYENVQFETTNKIAYVTISRPKVLNVLNVQTVLELMAIFSRIKNDNRILGCILTGAGEKAFVAGADIHELARQLPINGKDFARRGQGGLHFIEDLGKPVIAAVNGYALGGGCEIAMACTIRIASENAKFGQPEVSLGIIPGYGGTQRLPRLIGKGRAMELILTGDMIDAREAYRIGRVNKVVEPEKLIASCEEVPQKIFSR